MSIGKEVRAIYEVGPIGKVLAMRWTVGGSQKGLNYSCHAVSISGTNPTQNLRKKRKKEKKEKKKKEKRKRALYTLLKNSLYCQQK